jgi:ribosomal protein S18 acetylase RimI-like enzyme
MFPSVCTGIICTQGEGLHLLALGVLVLQRRRGLGTALLRLYLAQPHSNKFLHVQPDNTLARDFYERAGFIPDTVRTGYYRGLVSSEALRMVKSDK